MIAGGVANYYTLAYHYAYLPAAIIFSSFEIIVLEPLSILQAYIAEFNASAIARDSNFARRLFHFRYIVIITEPARSRGGHRQHLHWMKMLYYRLA